MTYTNRLNCLKASNIAVFLLLLQPAIAQNSFSELTAVLDKNSAALGKDFSVLIGNKDTTLFAKDWGDMKAKTIVPIASASKWLTAALVLQQVDEGKISLDDKVTKYLPVFEKYGKNYITIRQCLSHLTGIRKSGKLAQMLERRKYTSLDEQVADFAAQEIETNPGEAFNYSNIGLNIAGRVLEVVTRKRFDLLIKQKLLTPLGMRQTSFTSLTGLAPDPSSGARSTAVDYMAFLKMLLNGGRHNGATILSAAAMAELRNVATANVPMNDVPKVAAGFGYAEGAWVVEANGATATALASPGLFGTWPLIDYCRGYTFVFFVKDLLTDQKRELYDEMKKALDAHFSSTCN